MTAPGSKEVFTMAKHADQTTVQPGTVPAGIALEDVVEAVLRGGARAWSGKDDVSGYALQPGGASRSLPQPIRGLP
jgi:hypothetical protein